MRTYPLSPQRQADDRACLPLHLVPARDGLACMRVNAVYEVDRVEHIAAEPEIVDTPSASGKGQRIARCPAARWRSGATIRAPARRCGSCASAPWTIRRNARRMPTSSRPAKQPWVTLPPGAKAFAEFYNPGEVWSDEARPASAPCASEGRNNHSPLRRHCERSEAIHCCNRDETDCSPRCSKPEDKLYSFHELVGWISKA